jgi:tetratricopeptide (TPR) repeat protein
MGREPSRPRQYFYFCVALLIFLTNCSLLQEQSRRREMSEALAAGNSLFARGDFDESLNTYQKVLVAARDKPPADLATYNMGLIYAHPKNPKRNLRKAMDAFDRIIRMYPDSPWVEQAEVWRGVLNDTEESKQEVEKAKQDLEQSRQELEKNRAAIEKSRQEIDKSRLELEKTKQEIEKTKQVIEKSKQVDIEIDRKRRDRGR